MHIEIEVNYDVSKKKNLKELNFSDLKLLLEAPFNIVCWLFLRLLILFSLIILLLFIINKFHIVIIDYKEYKSIIFYDQLL